MKCDRTRLGWTGLGTKNGPQSLSLARGFSKQGLHQKFQEYIISMKITHAKHTTDTSLVSARVSPEAFPQQSSYSSPLTLGRQGIFPQRCTVAVVHGAYMISVRSVGESLSCRSVRRLWPRSESFIKRPSRILLEHCPVYRADDRPRIN